MPYTSVQFIQTGSLAVGAGCWPKTSARSSPAVSGRTR
jgi:hypothetical protein